jgi:hypothetical protein
VLARPPAPETLQGRLVRLEPVDPARHAADLYAASRAGDPGLWTYLGYGPFADEAAMREHVTAIRCSSPWWIWLPVAPGAS